MKYLITVFLTVLLIITSPLASGSAEHSKVVPLKEGVLLAASPKLEDPNFIHTVILLVSYGKEGALGLIINRPSGIDLKQLFPYIEGFEKGVFHVYLGGPVERNTMSVLFTTDTAPKGALKVLEGLYFTYDKDVLVPVLQNQEPKNKTRVYAGFASWAHGQLEQEIIHGAWVTMEANQDTVFTENPLRIWPSIFPIPADDNLVQLIRTQ